MNRRIGSTRWLAKASPIQIAARSTTSAMVTNISAKATWTPKRRSSSARYSVAPAWVSRRYCATFGSNGPGHEEIAVVIGGELHHRAHDVLRARRDHDGLLLVGVADGLRGRHAGSRHRIRMSARSVTLALLGHQHGTGQAADAALHLQEIA